MASKFSGTNIFGARAAPVKVVGLNPVHGEVYSIQHFVIKVVSDLRHVDGFLQFHPPIKLATTI
jgi:gamma-glutamylcyclotransferase (GGCT)/AIG2-like uncharacterized protein YtfP